MSGSDGGDGHAFGGQIVHHYADVGTGRDVAPEQVEEVDLERVPDGEAAGVVEREVHDHRVSRGDPDGIKVGAIFVLVEQLLAVQEHVGSDTFVGRVVERHFHGHRDGVELDLLDPGAVAPGRHRELREVDDCPTAVGVRDLDGVVEAVSARHEQVVRAEALHRDVRLGVDVHVRPAVAGEAAHVRTHVRVAVIEVDFAGVAVAVAIDGEGGVIVEEHSDEGEELCEGHVCLQMGVLPGGGKGYPVN